MIPEFATSWIIYIYIKKYIKVRKVVNGHRQDPARHLIGHVCFIKSIRLKLNNGIEKIMAVVC